MTKGITHLGDGKNTACLKVRAFQTHNRTLSTEAVTCPDCLRVINREPSRMEKPMNTQTHRDDCANRDTSECGKCPEHPHWSGHDAPNEQCHSPEDHVGEWPCSCSSYTEGSE